MDDHIDHDIVPIDAPKDNYELLVESIETKINLDYKDSLKMNGKILHDEEKIILNYYILVYNNSDINPFDDDIELNIEFIDQELPYVQIISNFLTPTMYDLRNYFFCFSSNSKYIYKITDLSESQLIIEEIISNIKYFLNYIKELESLNTFVYLGEYDMEHIYHINDFFRNPDAIDFFRINLIKDNKFYDKILYIICTELYFIVFWPIETNKSLGKILFYNKLSDTEFNFEEIFINSEKKKDKKRLKVIVNDINKKKLFRKGGKDFKRNHNIKIFKAYAHENNSGDKNNISYQTEKMDHYSDNFIKDFVIINKKEEGNFSKPEIQKNKKHNNIDDSYNKKNSFQFLFIDNNEDDGNDNYLLLQNEYSLFKKFIMKKVILEDSGYKKYISLYRLLFSQSFKDIDKLYSLSTLKEEIDKIIEFDEKLYEKYKDSKNNFDKEIIKNIVNNIVVLCTKLSELLYKDDEIKYYLAIMKKYANLNIMNK